ncbi:MAG: NAD-dependent epimerase/dehydratase family protein [Alphaproteobacteria bacterium]
MPLAFVTGATGFLGLNLVERLTADGWTIVAYHRASSDLKYIRRFPVTLAAGDLTDRAAIEAGMPAVVDAVFHCAANTTMWGRRREEQWRDNVLGTEAVLAASRARGAKRFVHVSTASVYGHGPGTITEESPTLGAQSAMGYARSKGAAEAAVKRAAAEGFAAVVVNPAHIVGRYDTHNWGRMIRMVERGRVPGVPPGGGAFCHAASVADARIAAAARGRIGQNYLLGGADATFLDVFRIAGRLTGKRVPRRATPAFGIKLYARLLTAIAAVTGREPDITPDIADIVTSHPRIDCARAVNELGYRPASLESMLTDAHGWMKSEGLL